jgi:hypothetical protein
MPRNKDMSSPYDASSNSGNRRHLPFPFSRFAVEPLSALVRQGVILCSSAILRGFPFALDQPGALQPLKGHEQGTRIDAENSLAHLFEPDGNAVPVHGFERQRFENEHVQSALDDIARLVRHKRLPPDQEEEYAPPTDCQEE